MSDEWNLPSIRILPSVFDWPTSGRTIRTVSPTVSDESRRLMSRLFLLSRVQIDISDGFSYVGTT